MRFRLLPLFDVSLLLIIAIESYWFDNFLKLISTPTNSTLLPFQPRLLLFKNFSKSKPDINFFFNMNAFNFWFLRKEFSYSKLKYSRTPSYDIVSGGLAAIFAGFLGFLICEKFGFELLDSLDFYFVLMYGIFLIFMTRVWLNICDETRLTIISYALSAFIRFWFFIQIWCATIAYRKRY